MTSLEQPPKVVSSIAEFVNAVTSINRRWKASRLWFRGHEDISHQLLPTLYRRENEGFSESSAFDVFWSRGQGLPQFARLHAREYWSWYFAARHHGLPSRLLDWSENALVALFFGTKNPRAPRIWVIDPSWVNEQFIRERPIQMPNDWDDKDFMRHWLPSDVRHTPAQFRYPDSEENGQDYSNACPVAIFPSATNPRLIAQQGMFTVHGVERDSLDAQLRQRKPATWRLARIDIAPEAALVMHEELGWLGLNKFLVDAGGDGLAEHLTDFYQRLARDES